MANKIPRIQHKRGASTEWEKAVNFVPLDGEIIIYSDLSKIKIGDGVTNVNDLEFANKNYKNVANLPTTNIDINIAYHLLKGIFVVKNRLRYGATCHTVEWDAPPADAGENAIYPTEDGFSYTGYYNIKNNEVYGYVDSNTKELLKSYIDNRADLNAAEKIALKILVSAMTTGW